MTAPALPRVGRHVGISSGLLKAIAYGQQIGCGALQVFPGNPTGWHHAPLAPDLAQRVRTAARAADLVPLVIHAPYIINLAGPDAQARARAQAGLVHCFERAGEIGAASIVLHVGSHRGSGLAAGIDNLVGAVRSVLAACPGAARLLLENSVGAGQTLGGSFVELRQVLEAVADKRVGLCLDTAHVWGAGQDISTPGGAAAMIARLDAEVGLHHLAVVHLNDSAVGLGSRRDVHARLGAGTIGLSGLGGVLAALGAAGACPTVLLETPDDGPTRERGWQEVVALLLAGDLQGALARQREVVALPIEQGSFPIEKGAAAF